MPYFGSTIFVVVLIAAVFMALTGYFLFARALFPRFVEKTERAWTERARVSFALGLPVAGVLAGVCVGLLNAPNPALRVVGFPITGVALGFTFAGTAGLAARIGRRLASPSDAGREWAGLLRAGIVLELSILFPILGWFVILPIAVIGGAGASTLALFQGGPKPAPPSAPPAPSPETAA